MREEVEVAELTVQGDELVLSLNDVEKLEAVHGEVRVPVSSVRGVEILGDALGAVHGIRTGTGIPGVLVVGTIRNRGSKAFVVVHHGHPRGIRVDLEGTDYDELIVGCDDPEALAASLSIFR